eukprot:3073093-Rhodomonas_salina.2
MHSLRQARYRPRRMAAGDCVGVPVEPRTRDGWLRGAVGQPPRQAGQLADADAHGRVLSMQE